MEWTETVPFVGQQEDANPLSGVVVEVTPIDGKYSTHPRLVLEIAPGERRAMDVFDRKEVSKLIRAWGADDKKWLGRRVSVLTEEKLGEKAKRILTAI